MAVIGIGIILGPVTCIYFGLTMPDCRWTKGSRKSLFRGELKGTPTGLERD